jgi:hypothetical protein
VSLLAAEGEPGHWTAVAFVSGMATAVMLVAIVAPGIAGSFAKDALEPAAAQALGVAALPSSSALRSSLPSYLLRRRCWRSALPCCRHGSAGRAS